MTVIMIMTVILSLTHLGAPTSWLGTANVGSDCSMKLVGVKDEQRNRFIMASHVLT